MSQIDFQLLEPKDNAEFSEFYFRNFGITPPSDVYTRWIVAKDEGKIVACFGLYRPVVVDSMGVDKEYRGTGLWKELLKAIPKLFNWPKDSGFYFITTRKRESAVCKKFGLEKQDSEVWKKVF